MVDVATHGPKSLTALMTQFINWAGVESPLETDSLT